MPQTKQTLLNAGMVDFKRSLVDHLSPAINRSLQMQHDIVKVCADSLRNVLKDGYGYELKSGHAHEIIAAFLGYKSKSALLADKFYPLSNL